MTNRLKYCEIIIIKNGNNLHQSLLYILLLSATLSCSKKAEQIFSADVKSQAVLEQSGKPNDLATRVKKLKKIPVRKRKPQPQKPKIAEYCQEVDKKFIMYGWGKSHCEKIKWHHVRNSFLGRPLIWHLVGNEQSASIDSKNTTLILCGVHGDEITPIKFCFDIIYYLMENEEHYREKMIVIAPIVTPDSFFKKYPTRTNYRGIDVNRNFPTKDWNEKAISLWKSRYKSDKRRYPGEKPHTEAEVIFQVNLIKRYDPHKIISVHAPLTLLDYDGPGDDLKDGSSKSILANQLLISMSRKASGYRIKNYPYFPGSLGNWAGNERKIPTYTLELPTSDNRRHKDYWTMFKGAIHAAIMNDLREEKVVKIQ